MKKKLEAELISIAHRILKLKNRAELDQLQQETMKLYEKISVLKFVEDNFNDVKPTIGYASAEEKLEEIYGIEEAAPVQANKVEAKEDEVREAHKQEREEPAQDKENDKGEGVTAGNNAEEVVSEEEKEETAETEDEPQAEEPQVNEEETETITDPQPEEQEEIAEGGPASEEEKRYTEEETDEKAEEPKAEEQPKEEPKQAPLFEFDTKQEEPKKQKEITFEDYRDYKEPEFVKKSEIENPQSINKEFLPKEPEVIQKQGENAAAISGDEGNTKPETQNAEPTPVRDWRDWEPSSSPYATKKEEPKEEPKAEAKAVTPNFEPVTPNTRPVQPAASAAQGATGRTITLGLNDRIAFEKHLFGGSGEDLNRVISQLNTFNSFTDARDFINDLVKPDYNNWKGKEEYEERLFQLVENRFN